MFSRAHLFLPVLLPAFLMVAMAGHAHADSKGRDRKKEGHEEVYRAQKNGDILPLAEILARLRPVTGPEIVDIEYETKRGMPVYEIKYVDKTGRRKEIYVDARNAAIIETGGD